MGTDGYAFWVRKTSWYFIYTVVLFEFGALHISEVVDIPRLWDRETNTIKLAQGRYRNAALHNRLMMVLMSHLILLPPQIDHTIYIYIYINHLL